MNIYKGIRAIVRGFSDAKIEKQNKKILYDAENFEYQKNEIETLISKEKVNHILHLLLSLLTGGLWIIIWISVNSNSKKKVSMLRDRLKDLYDNKKKADTIIKKEERANHTQISIADEIRKLETLRNDGLILESEFFSQKNKLLSI